MSNRRTLDSMSNEWQGDRLAFQGVYPSTCPLISPEDRNATFPKHPLPSCFCITYMKGEGRPNCPNLLNVNDWAEVLDKHPVLSVNCDYDYMSER